jgi:hypothetical protein
VRRRETLPSGDFCLDDKDFKDIRIVLADFLAKRLDVKSDR